MTTKRKSMHYARKRRICERYRWRTSDGELLAIERTTAGHRRIVTLRDGKSAHFDHTHQLATDGPDEDDNVRPLSEDGHKPKTKEDARSRKRIRSATGQNMPKQKRSIPNGGWQQHPDLKRTVGGKVVTR